MSKDKECGSCKFFAQGETCCFCENPKQTDDARKKYCYYCHGCDLHEEGTSASVIEYNKKSHGRN